MSSIGTPVEILRVQSATNNAISPVGAEIMSNLQNVGKSRSTSEGVMTASNPSDISDILEEIGNSKTTRGKNDLEKMKVRKGAGTDLDALSRIAEYYDKLPNMPSDERGRELSRRLDTFHEQMLRGEGGPRGDGTFTAEDIIQLLQEYDGDVTHQFAILETMRKEFGRPELDTDPKFIALLDEARASFADPEVVQEIKAGFHAAKEAARLGDRVSSDPKDFRDSYREMVRSGGNLGKVFDALSDFVSRAKDGLPQFEEIVDSFLQVAGDDMKSFGSSVEDSILGDVIAELKVLKNIKTAIGMVGDMMDKIERMMPDEDLSSINPLSLISGILGFAGSGVPSDGQVRDTLKPFTDLGPNAGVLAMNEMLNIHRLLPDSAIPSTTARQSQTTLLNEIATEFSNLEDSMLGT